MARNSTLFATGCLLYKLGTCHVTYASGSLTKQCTFVFESLLPHIPLTSTGWLQTLTSTVKNFQIAVLKQEPLSPSFLGRENYINSHPCLKNRYDCGRNFWLQLKPSLILRDQPAVHGPMYTRLFSLI